MIRLWNRLRIQLQNTKLNRYLIIKTIPIAISLIILLLGLSLGMADPGGSPPPVPD